MKANHEYYIRECIRQARETMELGNPPFGALLCHENEMLLVAKNTQITDNDITCHAEFNLIRKAVGCIQRAILTKSTIYSSNEPCPMCAGAIYWSGIRKVAYGCSMEAIIDIRGHGWPLHCRNIFSTAPEHVEVIGPVLEDEVVILLKDYYTSK